jgi:hypothetical protein
MAPVRGSQRPWPPTTAGCELRPQITLSRMAKTAVMPKPSAIWRATFAISIAGPSLQAAWFSNALATEEAGVIWNEPFSLWSDWRDSVGDFRDGCYRAWKDAQEDCS